MPACLASYIAMSASISRSAAVTSSLPSKVVIPIEVVTWAWELLLDHRPRAADRREQLLGDDACVALVRPREDHGELVAAAARDDVGLAQRPLEHLGEADHETVTGGVAKRIVDVLEAVEVEREHRAGAGAEASRVRKRPLELGVKATAVEQPRQRIVVGEVLELTLEALTLGDVERLLDRGLARRRGRSAAPRR